MRKVALSLGLVSLIAGLVQAQTPQVRKLWQKTFNGEVATCIVDTSNGGRDPLVVALEGGKLRTYDRQGSERMAVQLPQGKGLRWSRDIRFLGTFPNGVLQARNGNRIATTPGYSGVAEVANDGQAFTITSWPRTNISKDFTGGPVIYSHFADTLRFFDRSGRLIKTQPVPFERFGGGNRAYPEDRFSGDGSRFVVNIGDSALQAYDRTGSLVWRATFQEEGLPALASYSISRNGGVFAVYARLKSPGYRGYHGNPIWGRFYDPNGRIESELQIAEEDTIRYKNTHAQSDVSADGEHALFNRGEFMVKVSKTPPRVEWRLEARERNFYFGNALFSYAGDYILTQAGVRGAGGKIVVLDTSGRTIFEDPDAPYWNIRFAESANFFVSFNNRKIALYEIVVQ